MTACIGSRSIQIQKNKEIEMTITEHAEAKATEYRRQANFCSALGHAQAAADATRRAKFFSEIVFISAHSVSTSAHQDTQ